MKKLILIPILLLSLNCFSQKTWMQKNQDKIAHVGVGYIVGSVSYHFLYKSNGNAWKSRIGSVFIASLAGAFKEWLDKDVKYSDIGYTALGGGISLVLTINNK